MAGWTWREAGPAGRRCGWPPSGDDRGRGRATGRSRSGSRGVADVGGTGGGGAGGRAVAGVASKGAGGVKAQVVRRRSPSWRRCWTPGRRAAGYLDQCWTRAAPRIRSGGRVRVEEHCGRGRRVRLHRDRAGPRRSRRLGGWSGTRQVARWRGPTPGRSETRRRTWCAGARWEDGLAQGLRLRRAAPGRRRQGPGGDADCRRLHVSVAGPRLIVVGGPRTRPGSDLPDATAAGERAPRAPPTNGLRRSWTPAHQQLGGPSCRSG